MHYSTVIVHVCCAAHRASFSVPGDSRQNEHIEALLLLLASRCPQKRRLVCMYFYPMEALLRASKNVQFFKKYISNDGSAAHHARDF